MEHNFLKFHAYVTELPLLNESIEKNISQVQKKLEISNMDIDGLEYSRIRKEIILVQEKKCYDREGNVTYKEKTVNTK